MSEMKKVLFKLVMSVNVDKSSGSKGTTIIKVTCDRNLTPYERITQVTASTVKDTNVKSTPVITQKGLTDVLRSKEGIYLRSREGIYLRFKK